MAYQKLKTYLGFEDPRSRVSNILLFVPEVEEEMRQKLHIDVVALDRLEACPGVMRTEVWKELSLPNGEPAFFPDGSNRLSGVTAPGSSITKVFKRGC